VLLLGGVIKLEFVLAGDSDGVLVACFLRRGGCRIDSLLELFPLKTSSTTNSSTPSPRSTHRRVLGILINGVVVLGNRKRLSLQESENEREVEAR